MSARPTVSVIVPFAGDPAALDALVDRLAALRLAPGDEVIVADNRRDDAPRRQALPRPGPPPDAAERRPPGPVTVRRAAGVRAPAFARNRAAAAARGEWLVMIDADTEPVPGLLDAYFTPPPADATAILAGGITDAPRGGGLAARHSAGRAQMDQTATLQRGPWSYAQSANCAVRRSAFIAVSGFDDFARAGEDADLCFRLRAAGWQIESRPLATVVHRSRATVPALLEQLARHGAGAAWAERRHPGSFPAPGPARLLARLAGAARRAVIAALRGDGEQARRRLLEIAEALAFEGGRLLSNRARL